MLMNTILYIEVEYLHTAFFTPVLSYICLGRGTKPTGPCKFGISLQYIFFGSEKFQVSAHILQK
jgi:hypothetical protein